MSRISRNQLSNFSQKLDSIHLSLFSSLILHLLLFLLVTAILLLLGGLGLLSPHATRAPTTVWRCKSKVDMFLGVKTDDEGWNVDDLLSDTTKTKSVGEFHLHGANINVPNVPLPDQHTGVMDALGQTQLVNAGL
jgi:hypothetical protein